MNEDLQKALWPSELDDPDGTPDSQINYVTNGKVTWAIVRNETPSAYASVISSNGHVTFYEKPF